MNLMTVSYLLSVSLVASVRMLESSISESSRSNFITSTCLKILFDMENHKNTFKASFPSYNMTNSLENINIRTHICHIEYFFEEFQIYTKKTS